MVSKALQSLLCRTNPIFSRAHEGRRLPHAAVSVVVFLLLFVVGFLVAGLSARLISGDSDIADRWMDGMYGLFVAFGVISLVTWLWVRFFEKRSPATLGFSGNGVLRKYLIGFGLGLAAMGAVVGVMALAGGVVIDTESVLPTGRAAAVTVFFMLVAFVVQGGTEELVTRGWFMPVLGARYRPWIGLVVSSVLFAALHMAPDPVAIVNLLLFSLFLSLYVLKERSLWGACGWHSAWNWSMSNGLGITVSGHEPTEGTLIDLKTVGHPLLTGGEYGPEASLLTTAMLLVGILIILGITRPANSDEPALSASNEA